MSEAVIDAPVAPVEPSTPPPAAPEASLMDHAAEYHGGPEVEDTGDEPPPANTERRADGTFKPLRKRSQGSQKFDKIHELNIENKRLAEELAKVKSAPAPAAAPVVAAPASAFTDEKPTIKSLIAQGVEDPYEALPEAIADWRDAKKAHEAQTTQAQASEAEKWTGHRNDYLAGLSKLVTEKADASTVLATFGADITPQTNRLLYAACVTAGDKGAEFVYHLATHPADYARVQLDTLDIPYSESRVKAVQTFLSSRLGTGTTEAVPPPPAPIAHKPPTSVRPSAMKPSDELPGDDASLASHAKAYHSKNSFGR